MVVKSSQSTQTLQKLVNIAQLYGDLEPVFNVSGSSEEPALTAANDTMNAICGVAFPHKWNEINLPPFYTNSFQQDYAVVNPDGTSITNLAWLERGIAIDINNTAVPKPYRTVEVGRQLPEATGVFYNSATNNPAFLCNFFPNNSLYYGVWGQGNLGTATLGNNPGPGSVYTNPVGPAVLSATWSSTAGGQAIFQLTYIPSGMVPATNLVVNGALPSLYSGTFLIVSISGNFVTVTMVNNPGIYQAGGIIGTTTNLSMPANPITQIQDANGNLLLLTGYGTEGTTAPQLPAGATPGQTVSGEGATTIWTVIDPYGQGFRILPVPSQTGVVWQIGLTGQMTPVRFTSLKQTLFPLPDQFEPNFRQGFIAQLYRYSPEAKIRSKFVSEWQLWLRSLEELRAKQDRETEENMFTLDRGIMGGRRGSSPGQFGPQWPFNSPGPVW